MKTSVITLFAAALLFAGCNSSRRGSSSTAGNTGLKEIEGIYTGTMPCADCDGIETKVIVNDNFTYSVQTQYVGVDEKFTEVGNYKWDADGRIITFDDDFLGKCLVEGNALFKLIDGKKDTGVNAEYHRLEKVDRMLVEKYWKLVELYGKPVTSPVEAHVIFHIEGSRYSGNAGCNRISGSYRARDNARISFSQPAATQMMCLSMDTETMFKDVIVRADSYSVQGDTLVLNRARMAPLARFVAVYMQ